MRNMISESKSRVYLSVSGNILPDLLTEMQVAHQRGIKMVVITDTPFPQEGMTVHVLEKPKKQVRIIVDSTTVLTGDIDEGEFSTCLYSGKKNVVDLLKESLQNEIKVVEMMRGFEAK